MTIFGLILNFLGSFLLIKAGVVVEFDKDYGSLKVSETKKKLYKIGLYILCLGFVMQLIAVAIIK